jgi:cell division protein ZapB
LAVTIIDKGIDNMLDIEAILQQFELIEQKVEQVVQARQKLQQENQDLNNRIGLLENLIQEKNDAEKKHEELNALVRKKIDNLIGRLEGITEE